MPSVLISSVFLCNAFCTEFIWIELNWNLGKVHVFQYFSWTGLCNWTLHLHRILLWRRIFFFTTLFFSCRYLLNFPMPIEFTSPLYKEHLTDDVVNQQIPYLWQIYWWDSLRNLRNSCWVWVNCIFRSRVFISCLRVYHFGFSV